MEPDSFRFLDPWTTLLPRQGGAVVAFVGSGGCTTLLLRCVEHLSTSVDDGADAVGRLLVTQTTDHPVPVQWRARQRVIDATGPLPDLDWSGGPIWAVGPALEDGTDRHRGLDVERIEDLTAMADVALVQAHASCGAPLRSDGIAPRWPRRTALAFCVAPLSVVGRAWNERSVAGAVAEIQPGGEPRRVRTEDVLEQVRASVRSVPGSARPLPFLTAFGAFRDLDGMFALVQGLWDPPRVPVVCLGELLGDERRDAADLRGLEGAPVGFEAEGERVYALYPAALDGDEE